MYIVILLVCLKVMYIVRVGMLRDRTGPERVHTSLLRVVTLGERQVNRRNSYFVLWNLK